MTKLAVFSLGRPSETPVLVMCFSFFSNGLTPDAAFWVELVRCVQ